MFSRSSRLLAVFVLALGVEPTAARAESNKEIIVGALFAFSGPYAFLGQETFRGAEIASQMINERGGVNGARVVWEKADATSPSQAASEAERLASRNIKVVFGTASSPLAMVASRVLEREKVVFWEPGSSEDDITTRGFKYTFRVVPPGSVWARALADFAVERVTPIIGKTPSNVHIAIKFEDGSFGASVNKALSQRLKERGVVKITAESYSARATDLSSLVLKLKAANPDIILSTDYPHDATLFARQSKELGLQTRAILGWAGIAFPKFYKDLGDYAEGMMSINFPIDLDPARLPENTRKLREEFRSRYVKQTGNNPPVFAVAGFDGAWALLRYVLPKAEKYDADAIRAAAFAVDEPEGTLTMGWGLKFSKPGEFGNHSGQNMRAIVGVTQWQDGKLVLVWPDDLAAGKLRRPK